MSTGVGIRIEARGAADVLGRLREIARRGASIQPALDAIADAWLARVDLEFVDSVDPYGRPWAPLKVREGQPLVDTGRLAASYDKRVEPLSLAIGTNVEYASTHQFGREGGADGPPIPARPMLPAEGLPEAWLDDALEIVSGYLDEVTG